MSDLLTWLKDAWPYGGSALVGSGITVATGRFSGRTKKRKMRKRLYRELAGNMLVLLDTLRTYHSMLRSQLVMESDYMDDLQARLSDLSTVYYDYCAKDLDALHDLSDSAALIRAFDTMRSLREQAVTDATIRHLDYFLAQLSGRIRRKQLSRRLLLRHAPDARGNDLEDGINAYLPKYFQGPTHLAPQAEAEYLPPPQD